jgi:soluble lytic murein transglycosylase-like protein
MGKFSIMKTFFLIFFIFIKSIYSQIDIIDPNVILIEPPKEEKVIKEQYSIPYFTIIREYSKKYSLKTNLVTSIIKVESNYNYRARSKKNAIGLMQVVGAACSSFNF